MIDGNPVDLVESFTYLGSIQTSDGYCRSDIARRIGLASLAMSSLNNIWNVKYLSIQTKVRVYQTLVLSILLYASETWTLLASDMKAIESFTWNISEGSLESGGMILSVTLRSLYALVSHLCLTGLQEVAMPSSDMWQECQITVQHTRPCYAKSSYRSVDPQTLHGNVHQADHVPNGPTNSAATTTMFPLRLCGGKPYSRATYYGPSWLRVNDDDVCRLCFETTPANCLLVDGKIATPFCRLGALQQQDLPVQQKTESRFIM